MSNYGYGSGNYLTNFEDYYKSSEDSEEEGDRVGVKDKAPVDSDSSRYYTESEEEDRQSYQGITKEEQRKFMIKAKPLESLRGPGVKKCSQAQESVNDGEKVFSIDYGEVCQYKCPLCSMHIDTDKLSSHLNTSHVGVGRGNTDLRPSEYSRETWHRCGLCQKAMLFTRLKVRYHVISEHGVSIKDYNEKFMKRTGRLLLRNDSPVEAGADLDPSSVSKDQISDDYSDLLKTVCKICNKTVEMDKFR